MKLIFLLFFLVEPVQADISLPAPKYVEKDPEPPELPPHPSSPWIMGLPPLALLLIGTVVWIRRKQGSGSD